MVTKKSIWSQTTKIIERISRGKSVHGRDLQLRAETLLLFALASRSTPIFTDFSNDVLSHSAELIVSNSSAIPSHEEQARFVRKYLMQSVLRTLRTTSDIIDEVDKYKSNERVMHEIESRTKKKHGFVPVVRDSNISGAGKGLHIEGSADAGSILALYPGTCYMPSDLWCLPDYPQITKNNEYLIWRYDGIVIDGKVALVTEEMKEAAENSNSSYDRDASRNGQEIECIMHPFCHGHMANHPKQGGSPNCIQFMFDMHMTRDLKGFRHLIPNALHAPKKAGIFERLLNLSVKERVPSVSSLTSSVSSLRIPTLMLIALRDIQDEEVFMNYRFNPNAPHIPHWYHDCDPESSRRRWNETGILFSR